MAIRDLETALGLIESRITGQVSGTTLAVHWSLTGIDPDHLAQGAVAVRCTASENAQLYRDRDASEGGGVAWVTDTIEVEFAWRLASAAYRTGRDAAITRSRLIRQALMARAWQRQTLGCSLEWASESIAAPDASSGWIVVTQSYQMHRLAPLAGATSS